ncbi:MAG: prepilin-type N-terminal cleavage/methylation domain-containing protein [Candidatus Omnitrophota bacterium]|jgi:type II secretion system protein G|nr:MAG: prepilin-type N-terminal cleavage/methylation domain-containing protein [Candidatus Omnitrophota bacterium]
MKTKYHAFTLIELLIVVAIIGILAAIAVPNFLNAQMRAKVSRCVSDMKALHTSMELYFLDNNSYPPDFDSGQVPGVAIQNNEILSYAKLTTPIGYMGSIPIDPFFLEPIGRFEHVKLAPLFQYAGPHSGVLNPRPAWRPSNTIYTITSLGPDKVDQQAWSQPHDLVRPRIYSPTNGLKSAGDIYTSNNGVIFE